MAAPPLPSADLTSPPLSSHLEAAAAQPSGDRIEDAWQMAYDLFLLKNGLVDMNAPSPVDMALWDTGVAAKHGCRRITRAARREAADLYTNVKAEIADTIESAKVSPAPVASAAVRVPGRGPAAAGYGLPTAANNRIPLWRPASSSARPPSVAGPWPCSETGCGGSR